MRARSVGADARLIPAFVEIDSCAVVGNLASSPPNQRAVIPAECATAPRSGDVARESRDPSLRVLGEMGPGSTSPDLRSGSAVRDDRIKLMPVSDDTDSARSLLTR